MRFFRDPPGFVAAGSTKTLSRAVDRHKTVKLDTVTGSVVTLPPAIGDGCSFRFYVTLRPTSNTHIVKVANATDVFIGVIRQLDADLATVNMYGYAAGATDDTITIVTTANGGTLGEWLEVEDIAAGIWFVRGQTTRNTPATPFSATVS